MRNDPDSWALWISSEACRSGQSLGSRRLRVGVEKMRPMRVAPILAVDIFVPQLYCTSRILSKMLGGVLFFRSLSCLCDLWMCDSCRSHLSRSKHFLQSMISRLLKFQLVCHLAFLGISCPAYHCTNRSTPALSNCGKRMVKRTRTVCGRHSSICLVDRSRLPGKRGFRNRNQMEAVQRL
jgi:hypothetical protein